MEKQGGRNIKLRETVSLSLSLSLSLSITQPFLPNNSYLILSAGGFLGPVWCNLVEGQMAFWLSQSDPLDEAMLQYSSPGSLGRCDAGMSRLGYSSA
jgi:hypothetical protein